MAQFPINLGGGGGADLDAITAGAPQILEGYTGLDSDGDALPGSMPNHAGEEITVTPNITSSSGYLTMRVPEGGYYNSSGRLQYGASNLGNASTAHVLDTATFTSRYGIGQTGAIPSKAAATYNTSASNQTIAAGQYLSGAQTIRGVATSNLTAANVKAGVNVQVGDSASAGRIANVTGSFTSDGTITAATVRNGYIGYSNGSKITGSLSINSATSFSVAQSGNNTVSVTCATPAAATGRPWGGLYVRGKVGGYPTSTSDGFFVGRVGGLNANTITYTSASNMPSGSTVYFRGWDYAFYNTTGSTSTYDKTMWGNSHNIGGVTIGLEGYATITASGNWTLPTGANRVVFFAVGAGGGTPSHHFAADDSAMASGGGGGGYTVQTNALTYAAGTVFTVTIGAGVAGGDGGSTIVKQGSTTLATAAGGKLSLYALNPTQSVGGAGGSGGGGGYNYGGTGGTNGGNGSGSSTLPSGSGIVTNNGGSGQGTSTTFNGITYSGGGGGGTSYTSASRASGGSWGGGAGGIIGANAGNGTANSGGGAGGGAGQGGSTDPSARTGGSGVVIAHYYHA